MKFAFVTCVQLGLSCIEAVIEMGGKFEFFATLPDDKARSKSGRIYLDQVARESQTPLLKIDHVSDPRFVERIKQDEIDYLFIIGWSQIAPESTLSAPQRGCIGMHPTLLPEGRGRASIPWAIVKGLDQTGVTMFQLDEGVDTGPILAQERIRLHPRVDATELYQLVQLAHVSLIKDAWPSLEEGRILAKPQDHEVATEWPGRTPIDGHIQPADMSCEQVDRLVRATTKPYPGAYVEGSGGKKTIIWRGVLSEPSAPAHPPVQCSDGQYWPTEIETAGG